MDNFSQKTGYTTQISAANESHSQVFNDSNVHLLLKQHELQKRKIRQLEEEKARVDAD